MANGEVTTNDIMEFLREHMVTKEELSLVNKTLNDKIDRLTVRVIGGEERMETFATKDDLLAMKSDIITSIDGFAKQNQTFDQEMASTIHRQDRFEERLGVVEHKLGLAT